MNIRPTMNNDEQTKFIDELRELKEMKKLTLEQIVERTEQNGERVCLSTVKSVFSENTKHKHDYNNTLIPIFNALSDEKDDEIAFKNEQIRHHYEAMDDKDRLISELYTKIFDLQNMIIEIQKNK